MCVPYSAECYQDSRGRLTNPESYQLLAAVETRLIVERRNCCLDVVGMVVDRRRLSIDRERCVICNYYDYHREKSHTLRTRAGSFCYGVVRWRAPCMGTACDKARCVKGAQRCSWYTSQRDIVPEIGRNDKSEGVIRLGEQCFPRTNHSRQVTE